MTPQVWIRELTFSDGSVLKLSPGDVVIIVGPNNAGKSASLRAIRDKVTNAAHQSPVVTGLSLGRVGTVDDLAGWLSTVARRSQNSNPQDPVYEAFNTGLGVNSARNIRSNQYNKLIASLRDLRIFVVEVGEPERFYPSAGGHGPVWVNEVLTKDLQSDPDLHLAREFVKELIARLERQVGAPGAMLLRR